MAAAGDLLGPYRLREVIGRGGFATVFRATHEGLGIDRAVKVLDQQYVEDTQIRHLFSLEAKRVATLHSPRVVQVHDAGESDSGAWIASELMTGGTVADALRAERQFTAAEVRTIGACVAEVLAEAHAASILHRDVKPANVFLTTDGAKLGDFGVAIDITGQAHASTVVGTLSYMAPEQDGGEATDRSDIYGLGALLFEAWTKTRAPALARIAPTWPP